MINGDIEYVRFELNLCNHVLTLGKIYRVSEISHAFILRTNSGFICSKLWKGSKTLWAGKFKLVFLSCRAVNRSDAANNAEEPPVLWGLIPFRWRQSLEQVRIPSRREQAHFCVGNPALPSLTTLCSAGGLEVRRVQWIWSTINC